MEELLIRAKELINTCWITFSNKVGNRELNIYKEASMQLQYAYLLLKNMDSILENEDESINIELETTINVNERLRECDILITCTKNEEIKRIPIEMKCYRNISSSGGKRGAQDIFRFEVYKDLQLLENYQNENTVLGVQLIMTDARNFVHPRSKEYKSWHYDISDGYIINNGITINTPIGGDDNASISLHRSYNFSWNKINDFYFLNLQGE